ncbi:Alpha/beta hydrolase fold-3, partial [Tothia fuscella]
VRIYQAAGSTNQSVPGAVFFHGGGWMLGSIAADDLFCRKLASDLNHVVVSVEYRLAPENVFPAAIDDCYSACLWTSENAKSLGIDPSQIYVTGNSAGGHLAAAVALKLADSGKASTIAAQVLRIPLTCHPSVWPGEKPPPKKNMPILEDSTAIAMINAFITQEKDRGNYLVSPLLASAELLRQLPPTYIDVCSADPLAAGGIAYAKKLEDHGVPVKLFVLDGMPH